MRYWLDIPSHVRRQIEALPNSIRPRVKKIVAALKDDPRPKAAKPLEDELAGYYRIKVETYRIIYTIHEDIVTVEIARVVKRDNRTYAGLP